MGRPNTGDAKVDKILSSFSQFYTNLDYIADAILPIVKVKNKTGKYAKYGKENFRAYIDQIFRAPGTRAHTVDYSVSQGNYICEERSIEKPVPDEFYDNTDDPYDPERDAVAVIKDNIAVNKELALAMVMADTNVLTQNTTLSGTSQWSDVVNSDPIGDITTGIKTVRVATGSRPNVMVLGLASFQVLKNHPAIREQLKYTNSGQPSDDQLSAFLKSYFRLKEVLIGEAVYNSATEGQSDVLDDIWGDNVWLISRAKTPTLMRASFGYTIMDVPDQVDIYREESHLRNVVRARVSFDQNIMDATLGYLIKDTNA